MDQVYENLVYKLKDTHELTREEFKYLIEHRSKESDEWLHKLAYDVKLANFGNKIYVRGLIEISNICKNNCIYCGIRRDSPVERYRLDKETILSCCEVGYELGYRTFVLQGGEDGYYNDDVICDIIATIHERYPDCAITMSLGERSKESYERMFAAGATRYLLRHESANREHYGKLHPRELSLDNRKACLWQLKDIGYQIGAGFMVGSPYQSSDYLADDYMFLQMLKPQMVGIGPFIPSANTPFKNESAGTLEDTLFHLSMLRLLLPHALIPATTALATIDPLGREKGIHAGANVAMPNLSPKTNRRQYALYDNKVCMGDEAAECWNCMVQRFKRIGSEVMIDRGDYQD